MKTAITDRQAFEQLAVLFRRVDVSDELSDWLHANLRRTRTVDVVFDPLRASGYVWLRVDGIEQVESHPGLAGIDDAHRVLLAGVTAQHTLHLDCFGCSANSLRNRLENAAQWADGVRCAPLATCIRAISVGNGGSISYATPAGISLTFSI